MQQLVSEIETVRTMQELGADGALATVLRSFDPGHPLASTTTNLVLKLLKVLSSCWALLADVLIEAKARGVLPETSVCFTEALQGEGGMREGEGK